MCGFLRGFNELTHVEHSECVLSLLLLSGVAMMRPYSADVLLHNTAPLDYHCVKPRSAKRNFVNSSAQAFIFLRFLLKKVHKT